MPNPTPPAGKSEADQKTFVAMISKNTEGFIDFWVKSLDGGTRTMRFKVSEVNRVPSAGGGTEVRADLIIWNDQTTPQGVLSLPLVNHPELVVLELRLAQGDITSLLEIIQMVPEVSFDPANPGTFSPMLKSKHDYERLLDELESSYDVKLRERPLMRRFPTDYSSVLERERANLTEVLRTQLQLCRSDYQAGLHQGMVHALELVLRRLLEIKLILDATTTKEKTAAGQDANRLCDRMLRDKQRLGDCVRSLAKTQFDRRRQAEEKAAKDDSK